MTERRDPEVLVYPGAPLRAVAIEVGFPPLLDAFPRFAKFQRRHPEFGTLYETSADDDGDMVPDGHEFARPRTAVLMRGQERAVTVAREQLAIITYPYATGFAGFTGWALPLLREGLDDLEVGPIKRVSFKYENRIKHDVAKLDLGSIFKVAPPAPVDAKPGIRHAHLHWDQSWEGGSVAVEIHCCELVSTDEVHLNITAHRRAVSGNLDEIESLVHEAHRRARLTFEELITPAFRDRLKSPPKSGV